MEEYAEEKIDQEYGLTEQELKALKHSFNRIMRKYKQFEQPLEGEVATIGLTGIKAKLDDYTSLDEYMTDIVKFVVAYSQQKETTNSKDDEHAKLKRAAKELKTECQHDVKCIRQCAECYLNWVNDNVGYFEQACSTPHLLVMAKYDNYPYWPAKVMSVFADVVSVEFFGDHTNADVSDKHCYLYCTPKKTKNSRFNEAVDEAEHHIHNIKEKFGSFVPARNSRSYFDAVHHEQHLMTMFPGAYKSKVNSRQKRNIPVIDLLDDDDTPDVTVALDMPSLGSTEDVITQNTQVKSNRKRRASSKVSELMKRNNKDRREENSSDNEQNGSEEEAEKIGTLEKELKVAKEQLKQAQNQIRDQKQQIEDQAKLIKELREQIDEMQNPIHSDSDTD